MIPLKIGDVRYYNGTLVTICEVDVAKDNYKIKWFVENTLNEKTVSRYCLSLLPKDPEYMDYIHHLEVVHEESISEDSSSDGLVEFMLNDTVHTIQDAFPELDHEKLVDVVYDVINKLTDPFHYYLQCVAADGYEAAIIDIQEKDENFAKELKEDVLKSSREYDRN